jgi:hypothetical protein
MVSGLNNLSEYIINAVSVNSVVPNCILAVASERIDGKVAVHRILSVAERVIKGEEKLY